MASRPRITRMYYYHFRVARGESWDSALVNDTPGTARQSWHTFCTRSQRGTGC
jgi:hypothetical protein